MLIWVKNSWSEALMQEQKGSNFSGAPPRTPALKLRLHGEWGPLTSADAIDAQMQSLISSFVLKYIRQKSRGPPSNHETLARGEGVPGVRGVASAPRPSQPKTARVSMKGGGDAGASSMAAVRVESLTYS